MKKVNKDWRGQADLIDMDEIIPHAYLHPLTPSIVVKTNGLIKGFVQISAQICFVAQPDWIQMDFKEIWTAKKNHMKFRFKSHLEAV